MRCWWQLAALLLTACTCRAAVQLKWLGQVFPPTGPELPTPVAFFPLTEGIDKTIQSFPDGQQTGAANFTVEWAPDSPFGAVIPCDRQKHNAVFLDPVQYGANGSFTVSFWFKAYTRDDSGLLFSYMFSTTAGVTRDSLSTVDTFAPNQINAFLPNQGHPAYGMVRTAVKDSTDLDDIQVFLDSDGSLSNNNNRTGPQNWIDVDDNLWHMYTVTTHPDLTDGYVVYVDGQLAAHLPLIGNTTADGGQPILLDTADIFLCGRSDGDPRRYFSGSITHLAIWDLALTDTQVSGLYHTVPQPGPGAGTKVNASTITTVMTTKGRQCLFPMQYLGAETSSCIPAENGSNSTYCYDDQGQYNECSLSATLDWTNMQNFVDNYLNDTNLATLNGHVQICSTNSTSPDSPDPCPTDYTCAALPGWTANVSNAAVGGFRGSSMGVCARLSGVFYSNAFNAAPPSYFFPLTDNNVNSWPLPEYSFYNFTLGGGWVDDPLFGSVVLCQNDGRDSDSGAFSASRLNWGVNGSFAMNLWFAQTENEGSLFQYLLSARNPTLPPLNDTSIFLPNQFHVYLPEAKHPAHGLVRAIVKDSTDDYIPNITNSWLDTDGMIGSNAYRVTPRQNFSDGLWHMLTITTVPSGSEGFQIWVDGLLLAEASSLNEVVIVDGGRPIFIDSDLVLCGRSDYSPNRYFDGKVAHLSIFDTALDNSTIGLLYSTVLAAQPQYVGAPPPPGPSIPASPAAILTLAAPLESAGPVEAPVELTIISVATPGPSEEGDLLPGFSNAPPSPVVLTTTPDAPLQASPPPAPVLAGQAYDAPSPPALASQPPPPFPPAAPQSPSVRGSLGASSTQSGTRQSDDSDDDNGGLSGGAIVGIVVAAMLGTLLLGALATFLWMRRTPSWQKPQRMQDGIGSGSFGDPAGIGVQLSDASLGKSRFLSSGTSAPINLKATTM